MKFRFKQTRLKTVVLLICACLILIGALCLLHHAETQMDQPASPQSSVHDSGKPANADVETILVMGLDKYEKDLEDLGYLNDQQADFLMLLILDRQAQTCDLLHLNRDTMTEIHRLGVGGGEAGTYVGQLCLAHTYGSGGSDSCINTAKAVSGLLDGIRIDHYVSVTLDAIGIINDLAGGVTVKLMDDFTDIDPAMVQGKNVCLNGDQATAYVRSRGSLEDKTNLHRMERQRQYMNALSRRVLECQKEDDHFLAKAIMKINGYFTSDYTSNQLNALADEIESYTFGPIHTLKGKAVQGEKFTEFYVDEDSLEQTLDELFPGRE